MKVNDEVRSRIEKHALMVNEIVQVGITSIKEESSSEYDVIKMIQEIGKNCFIKGYAEGLKEVGIIK